MLVEFRVKNYRSIGEEQVFSMVRGAGDENPQNTIEPQSRMKHGLLRSAVLYGANASGKSNMIRALHTMCWLVINSVEHKPGDKIKNITPFAFHRKFRTEPTEFDLTFIHDDIRYQYGFAVDSKSIREEWLYSFPKGQQRLLFHRTPVDQESNVSDFVFGASLTGDKNTIRNRTLNNVLFLSKAANENHPLLHELLLWFRGSLKVGELYSNVSRMVSDTARMINESSETSEWIHNFVRYADFGISDIITEFRSLVDDPEFMRLSKEERNDLVGDPEQYKTIKVKSVHVTNPNITLDFDEESQGTKKYFGLSGLLFRVLQTGSTLVIDELDSSMHPLLVRKIVELFHDPEVNKNNAQLIFSTHNSNMLDPELFRRDQIWFVEKDKKEQSQYYSLLEYKTKPRKNEAWEKGYLAGRYGAIPFLGRFRF